MKACGIWKWNGEMTDFTSAILPCLNGLFNETLESLWQCNAPVVWVCVKVIQLLKSQQCVEIEKDSCQHENKNRIDK